MKVNDGSSSGSYKQKQGLKKDSNHSFIYQQVRFIFPRTKKLIRLNNKVVARSDKSLSSLRDGTGKHLELS